jgi:anti-anti-sigma factor
VTVAGEIDDCTASALRQVLASAATIDAGRIELDLTDVTFFSCAGLTALFGAQRAAAGRLDLVGAGQRVRRVLELLGLETAFESDKAAQDHASTGGHSRHHEFPATASPAGSRRNHRAPPT